MQRNKETYMAGIVTYNPDISKLKETIGSILKQSLIEELLIVDNNSSNLACIENFVDNKKIFIVKNKDNLGIASALNCIMERACGKGYEWVLTCDQDSVMPEHLLENYMKYIEKEDVGIVCPTVYDENGKFIISKKTTNSIDVVEKCITSGSFNRSAVWEKIGGFDEFMFIDGVDFDYCYRLRAAGYTIIQSNEVSINHKIGNISLKKVGGFEVVVKNHNSFRKYYIVRNRIYMDFKHYAKLRFISSLFVIKTIVLVLFFEKDKTDKIKAIKNGFYDGLKYGKLLIKE